MRARDFVCVGIVCLSRVRSSSSVMCTTTSNLRLTGRPNSSGGLCRKMASYYYYALRIFVYCDGCFLVVVLMNLTNRTSTFPLAMPCMVDHGVLRSSQARTTLDGTRTRTTHHPRDGDASRRGTHQRPPKPAARSSAILEAAGARWDRASPDT